MSKYVKILVDDDFDSEEHKVYIDKNDKKKRKLVEIFKPKYTNVLDFGYIGLIDFMGDDKAIVDSARVSYGNGTKKVNSDENLLRYLMRNNHSGPYEQVEFKFHIKAPIFVFRQLVRHRTANLNEMSGRYSELPNEIYMPSYDKMLPQSENNKQGRSDVEFDVNTVKAIELAIFESFDQSYTTYKYLSPRKDDEGIRLPNHIHERKIWLSECAVEAVKKIRELNLTSENPIEITETLLEEKFKEYCETNEYHILDNDFKGMAKELARIVLPLATYSEMYWKCDLRNIFNFINLRLDSHAQYEIRVYAKAMLDLITPHVPWAVNAFMDYQFESKSFSKMEMMALRRIIFSEVSDVQIENYLKELGCTKREVKEFFDKIL